MSDGQTNYSPEAPVLIPGDLFVDTRGALRFVNAFDFGNVKRFYQVENHRAGFIRAWHGHKKEGKYVYVASGSALIGVVNLETEQIWKFVLSTHKPGVLWIPPGNANGCMNLKEDTQILYFSTLSFQEAKEDDIRFAYDKWNIWDPEYF